MTAQAADGQFTQEELEEMRENFPLQYKAVMATQATQRQLEEMRAQIASQGGSQQQGFTPAQYEPDVQMVIDQVPELVELQYDPAQQQVFAKAIAYDDALLVDPDWKDKPDVQRLAEAARRAKASFAAAAPAPASSAAAAATPAAPAATRQDPAAVIAKAPVEGPKGIGDLRGGATGNAIVQPDFRNMTEDQIFASLRPED